MKHNVQSYQFQSALIRTLQSKFLGLTAFHILLILEEVGEQGCNMTAICRQAEISSAVATQAVDRLVRGHYISRHPVPNDRRGINARLTAKGRALLAEIQTAINSKLSA